MELAPNASISSPQGNQDSPVNPKSGQDQISQNIEAVLEFYTREEQKISISQRTLEKIGSLIGQPAFLGIIILFVFLWTLTNLILRKYSLAEFDPPPFLWLQGIVGLGALLTATIVLTKQNRLAKLEERRAHLDLKVTLLTEQKAAKLIDLLEELRRDMPNVRNRQDTEAESLQKSMKPDMVLATLDESEKSKSSDVNIEKNSIE
jgi:uncharacterized membrane protein